MFESTPVVGRVLHFCTKMQPAFPMIIFVRFKSEAEALSYVLSEYYKFCVPYVHSNVARKDREQYQAQMRAGTLKVAVATDIWATGIDIPSLRSVVMACGGQAPIGLKQRAGRGTRKDSISGKNDFTIYDLQTSEEDGAQQQQRLAYYMEGGYSPSTQTLVTHTLPSYAEPNEDPDLIALLNRDSRTGGAAAITRIADKQNKELMTSQKNSWPIPKGIPEKDYRHPLRHINAPLPVFLLHFMTSARLYDDGKPWTKEKERSELIAFLVYPTILAICLICAIIQGIYELFQAIFYTPPSF